jgi:hypothetical protein
MADSTLVRTNARAYAREQFIPGFVSQQYVRSPLLGFLAAQSGQKGGLREVAHGLLNGKGSIIGGTNMSKAKRENLSGSERVHVAGVQTGGNSGSVKNLTVRDTTATVSTPTSNSQDQKRKTGFVKWTHKQNAVIVWKSTLRLAKGKYKVADVVSDAVGIAVQDMFDNLIDELWKGSPSDQDAEAYWSEQSGVNDVCHTTNTLYGIDRTSVTYYDSNRVTGAKTANLALIDDANITQGIQDTGKGVGLCLLPKSLYLTVKAEALTKGGTIIHKNTPEAALTGILSESVMYGDVLITYDPGLKDYSAVVTADPDMSDNVFMADMGDWCFQTNDGANFQLGEFVSLPDYSEGAIDAEQALVDLEYRFWTNRPWTSILYTAVT